MELGILSIALFPVVLLTIVAWRVTRNDGEIALPETIALWIVFVVLYVVSMGGVVRTRAVGQIAAAAVAVGLPLVCAAWGARVGRRFDRSPEAVGRLAFMFGVLPAIASPLVGIVVGCITDECV